MKKIIRKIKMSESFQIIEICMGVIFMTVLMILTFTE